MKNQRLLFVILMLVMASWACQGLGGGGSGTDSDTVEANGDSSEPETSQGGSDSEFPMPSDAENLIDADGNLNFQTDMTLVEAVAFYRAEFAAQGYTERELNTVVDESVFSLVFDGHASGRAIVVQGVDLGGNTNINIRFEDV